MSAPTIGDRVFFFEGEVERKGIAVHAFDLGSTEYIVLRIDGERRPIAMEPGEFGLIDETGRRHRYGFWSPDDKARPDA